MMRWLKFNTVGIMGVGVQLATLALVLHVLGIHYIAAAIIGVEAALLHNFLWHRRWTWSERTHLQESPLRPLLRFHLANGLVSIVGNVVLMGLLVGAAGMEAVPANFLSIVACSIVNFLLCGRFVFLAPAPCRNRRAGPRMGALWPAALLLATPLQAQTPNVVTAWKTYVEQTEARMARELDDGRRFLVQDFQPLDKGRADRHALLSGRVLVEELETRRADSSEIEVPDATIQHWLGAIFIPDVTLDAVLEAVKDPEDDARRQEDVLETRVLQRDDDHVRLYLKLMRKKIITVTYNTEHIVRYRRHSLATASSRTIATRIAELKDAGTPDEREVSPGEDRGFLWRLNSYWRYQEVDGGVIVECESITLSRSIPRLVGVMVRPIVASIAKQSMERTLVSMKGRLASPNR